MFKSFRNFNMWLRNNVQDELSVTLTRAVSRVSALMRQLSSIVSDYTSAYNSVQTLGYDSQGTIEDQTSSDRLTVPQNVLERAVNNMAVQRDALAADKLAFAETFSPERLLAGLNYGRSDIVLSQPQEKFVNLDGYASLIIRPSGSVQININPDALTVLGLTDIDATPFRHLYALPQMMMKIDTVTPWVVNMGVFTPTRHFPQALPNVVDEPSWRLICCINIDNPTGVHVFLDLNIDGQFKSYYTFGVNNSMYGLVTDFIPPSSVGTPLFSSWSTFKTYAISKGIAMPANLNFSYTATFSQGAIQTIRFDNQMTPDQQANVEKLFWKPTGLYRRYAGTTNTNRQMADIVFDTVIALTPDDISEAIQTLQ